MAMDADVADLVTRLNAKVDAAPADPSVAETRLAAWDWLPYMGPPEPVARVDHRFIPGPTADLPVRIYYPADAPAGGPAIVYLHGSGWTTANLEIADPAHRSLANATGCVVIAVNYQKAPEHRFPVAVHDAAAVVSWTYAHAKELAIDPHRLGIGGDSAGGNIAAAVCLLASRRDAVPPAFAILIYPATDSRAETPSVRENADGYLLTAAGVKWFWSQYLAEPGDGDDELASPLRAGDLTGLPPTAVITAGYDPLRDEGHQYASRLEDAGVRVIYRNYPGAVHGFFWMAGAVEVSRQLFRDLGHDVCELLDPTDATDGSGVRTGAPNRGKTGS
jgi:acetyl esterase